MMPINIFPFSNKYRVALIALLLGICFYLTYYFHVILETGRFFNHFFYIPVVLSSFWWKKKGLIVAVFLAADLVLSHMLVRVNVYTYNDYFRASLLIFTAVIIALLSEKLSEIEKRLRESEELHRATLQNISDAVFVTDINGLFTFISGNVNGIFGYTIGEIKSINSIINLIGQDLFNLYNPDINHEIKNIERTVKDKAGNDRHLLIDIRSISIKNGTTLYTCRDVTERRNAEEIAKIRKEQLLQADKMQSLGILVSGVAHEINNPNNFIILNTNMFAKVWKDVMVVLDEYYENNPDLVLAGMPYPEIKQDISTLLNGISEGALRIQRIVKSLKDFALRDKGSMLQNVCINTVVDSAILITNNLIKNSTNKFTKNLMDSIPGVKGNSQQLEQVIINLLTNACQALTDKNQKIFISTLYDKANDNIVIEVADEGVGISPEKIKNVMDPFYTGKIKTGGMGLGLSISYSIVKEHKGQIKLISKQGEATRAIVTLPC